MPKLTKQEVITMLGLQDETQLFALKNDPQKAKALYRLLAKKYHPDHKGGSHELFLQFQAAFEAFENDDYLESFINFDDWNNSPYQEEAQTSSYSSKIFTNAQTPKCKAKPSVRDYMWLVLWPLRGLIYGFTFILLNLVYAAYLLAGLISIGGLFFCIYSIYTIAFCDAGTLFEALKYITILILCWLSIAPAEWLSEKKEDLLIKVWIWWQM